MESLEFVPALCPLRCCASWHSGQKGVKSRKELRNFNKHEITFTVRGNLNSFL